ncbi:hypothetical protein KY285_023799 [Solanum tuberosum]|nr:hypothetical protein KY285_023799 [Solanum tuberosum]
MNQYSPEIGCKVVHWKHPSEGSFKCNTYGACKGNPGPSFGAYCVRDAAGRFIYAKAKRVGYGTNLVAELKAFRLGLEYCTSQNLLPLTMETDSLSVKKILDGLWEILWNVLMDVRKIWRLMEGVPVVVEHVYQEGNKLADFLTNRIFSFADADSRTYANIQELPRDARVILSMDRAQLLVELSLSWKESEVEINHRSGLFKGEWGGFNTYLTGRSWIHGGGVGEVSIWVFIHGGIESFSDEAPATVQRFRQGCG